ncbi:CocE/NonD family hydrolase [Luteibaculum oceani]|uniref:CocE/NonD family hydrolase n=1 Tax=Luteibaculum oceani TaxID=1294296 RepID=A0A5C6VE75_9FLAO|nr:CocE/NonD family hydrolase [Luteibaculum oceani]TXC82085.1 CocE/NonD family hydrolase [Luteibaculum oceani]
MKIFVSLIISLQLAIIASGQNVDSLYMRENYDQVEHFIPMRDGKKLYTLLYIPKDRSKSYPILLNRTCYNASGYKNWKTGGHPSKYLVRDGYIFAFQDVRGRYQSEGEFTTMTPNIPGNDLNNTEDIDESSDTYDAIAWMLENIPNNNGKVGQFGISYPGFYTAAALPNAHPALVASSPQAPISDFFFDDFHHMGAYLQSYTYAYAVFGYQKDSLTDKAWYTDQLNRFDRNKVVNGYEFHLNLGPLKNVTEKYHHDNFFWKETIDHPNYDEFWQKRNILPHLRGIDHAVLTVGGWFDAEDLYGPLNIYKHIERNNPKAKNSLIMGPWSHGGWAREQGKHYHNHIYFGDSISTHYLREIERKFFAHHLKGAVNPKLPEAYMFDTGLKQWKSFENWPSPSIPPVKLGFTEGGKLLINQDGSDKEKFAYTSDPNKPVPYRSEIEGLTFTPRAYMTDDQRHASTRPDVLTFTSDVLDENLTLGGEILAKLKVAISSTDADFIVKLIDVYPDTTAQDPNLPSNIVLSGYQQLVRAEVFRGRFRDSFEKPLPFTPNKKDEVSFPLQDILHTFKKGHRVMIQIHSTWFPYIDRNPQKYVENIYKDAKKEDFVKAEITIFGDSKVIVGGNINSATSALPK